MVITVPVHNRSANGLRPINLKKDIPQVAKLLETVFGERLDQQGRQALQNASHHSGPIVFWQLNPMVHKLAPGFVWVENDHIVGNATLLRTQTPNRYIVVNVAVHPDYRRRGIAYALMEAIIHLVQARQGRTIMLQVVKENTAALNLYQNLGFQTIGSMTSWYANISRLREIEPVLSARPVPAIRELERHQWHEAYTLDQLSLHPDLNWPERLAKDIYKRDFWHWLDRILNGRQAETWTVHNTQHQLIGLASIYSEWNRHHNITLRIHPHWQGQLERPLLAKIVRRLHYLPRRNLRMDHPDDDAKTAGLLREANFAPRRTLTHMRLDIPSRSEAGKRK